MDVESRVVPLEAGPGRQIPKAESKPHGRIDVRRRGDALVNQVEGLSGDGMLKAVDQKAWDVPFHHNRDPSGRAHIVCNALGHDWIGLNGTDHLDTWHQMGRHEKVGSQQPGGIG